MKRTEENTTPVETVEKPQTAPSDLQDDHPTNHILQPWYVELESVFRCCTPGTANMPFLQIFFAPVLYMRALAKARAVVEDYDRKKFYENQGYETFLAYFQEKITQNVRGDTPLAKLRGVVTNTLEEQIKLSDNRVRQQLEQRYRIEGHRIIAFHGVDAYRGNSRMRIYYQYAKPGRLESFFIPYISKVLEYMQETLLEDVDQIYQALQEKIYQRLSYRLNTYDEIDAMKNTAYMIYCFVLLSIDRTRFIHWRNEHAGMSRLIRENAAWARWDRDQYLSVIEYYPVNTIARVGALEALAEQGNLYALQDLYFLYQHDTFLYDIFGKEKTLLKSNPERSEECYRILCEREKNIQEKGIVLLPLFLRNQSRANRNFPLRELADNRKQYEEAKASTLLQQSEEPEDPEDPDERDKKTDEPFRKIIEDLYAILEDKTIPFNVELVWFLNRVMEEHRTIKGLDDKRLAVSRILAEKPWIAELMRPYHKNHLDILCILLELDNYGLGEDVLKAVCLDSIEDLEALRKHYGEARQRKTSCEIEYDLSEPPDEQLKEQCEKWERVAAAIYAAIQEQRNSSPTAQRNRTQR